MATTPAPAEDKSAAITGGGDPVPAPKRDLSIEIAAAANGGPAPEFPENGGGFAATKDLHSVHIAPADELNAAGGNGARPPSSSVDQPAAPLVMPRGAEVMVGTLITYSDMQLAAQPRIRLVQAASIALFAIGIAVLGVTGSSITNHTPVLFNLACYGLLFVGLLTSLSAPAGMYAAHKIQIGLIDIVRRPITSTPPYCSQTCYAVLNGRLAVMSCHAVCVCTVYHQRFSHSVWYSRRTT